MNLNVPFITIKRFKDNDKKSENSRLNSIFKLLDIDDSLLNDNISIFSSIPIIDFKKINKNIDKYRTISIEYLLNSLDNICNQEKNINIHNYKITDYCTGCGACKNICPKKAIKIIVDEYGYQKSVIDKSLCIKCDACKRICPMNGTYDCKKISEMKNLYSFKSKNNSILLESSSGGFSYVLSNFLNNNYYICGCYYDTNTNKAKHIIINPNNNNELHKIQGSKYIQSNTHEIIEKLLNLPGDSKVVFFGTPCQVAGLNNIIKLKKNKDRFVLVELICHGIPSSILWETYLNEMINKYNLNSKKINVKFRNKKYGWNKKTITIKDDKKTININESNDLFYTFFNRKYVNNKSCYECPFRTNSCADIKIGDYWGEKFINDKTGVSMILALTSKGEKIIDELRDNKDIYIKEEPKEDYFIFQSLSPQQESQYKEQIISDMKNKIGLKKILNKYYKYDNFIIKIGHINRKLRKKRNEK